MVDACNTMSDAVITAGGERGRQSKVGQIMCCESGRYGQQTMQAIQGMATRANETDKHCIAIAAQPAGIKNGHFLQLCVRRLDQ